MSDTYVRFVEGARSDSGKTATWLVLGRTNRNMLGNIRWYGPWRAYCFYPEPGTIFNEGCLTDIAAFCKTKTREHRG